MDTPSIIRTAQAIGLTGSFFLSGIYFASSHLVIHNLYSLPIATAATIFEDIYYTGFRLIVPLAFGSAASWSIAAYLRPDRRVELAVAVVAMLGTMALTRLVMIGGVNRLLEISAMGDVAAQTVRREEVLELLQEWRTWNWVRSGLAFASGLVGLVAVVG